MSGPKISEAELKRLRMIEEERRKLFQELVAIRDEMKRNAKDASDIQSMMVCVYGMEEIRKKSKKLSEIQNEIDHSLSRVEEVLRSTDNEQIKKEIKKLSARDKDSAAIREVRSFVVSVREKHIEEQIAKVKAASQKSLQQAEEKSTGSGMSYAEYVKDIFPDGFVTSEQARILALLAELKERAEAVEKFKKKEERGVLTGRHAETEKKVKELLEDTGRDNFSMYEELHRLDVMYVRTLRDKIEKAEEEADRLDRALSEELARYHALCAGAGEEPRKFAFEWESVQAIRYECGRLLSEETDDGKIRALMKNVRESLKELGYVYLGEKEEGICFYREIYRVHDNVILHVIYDSDGKVTMEVAMEDDCDRVPMPREIDEQVKEQQNFCSDYERIFDAINAKGIGFKKDTLFEPDPAFAQIINTSDFNRETVEEKNDYYDYYADKTQKYLYEE